MGVLLGSSTHLSHHHTLIQYKFHSISPCECQKVAGRKKAALVVALTSGPQDGWGSSPNDGLRLHRRSLALVGISVSPFLKLKEVAAEVRRRGESDIKEPVANIFRALLSSIGILSSATLGALYTISKGGNAELESTVGSMQSLLEAKQTYIASMEKSFEIQMLKEQEEHQKQLKRVKEEGAVMAGDLALASSTISALGQQLQGEKRLLAELRMQLNQLQSRMSRADKEKGTLGGKIREKMDTINDLHDRIALLSLEITDKETSIEALKQCVTDRESESKNLKFNMVQTDVEFQNTNSEIEELKIEVQRIRGELNSKKSMIGNLGTKLELLIVEREESREKIKKLKEEYDVLSSSSARKADLDSKLLSRKDKELKLLDKRLEVIMEDARESLNLVEKMEGERDTARTMVGEEVENAAKLKQELDMVCVSLEATESEVSTMSEQLEESERERTMLEKEILRVRSEYSDMEMVFRKELEKARAASIQLSAEVVSVKNLLHETVETLNSTSDELKNALEDKAAMEIKLLEICEKAGNKERELKEVTSMITTLELELEFTLQQWNLDNEIIEALVSNLHKVNQELEEARRTTSSLSQDLETIQSKAMELEMKNEELSKSVSEQKRVILEAGDHIVDAQNLLQRLVDERDEMAKKSAKLEEDLAMTKGEILRTSWEVKYRRGPSEEQKSRDRNDPRREEGPPPVSEDSK